MIIFLLFITSFIILNLIFYLKKYNSNFYFFWLLVYLSIGYFFSYFFIFKHALFLINFILLAILIYLLKKNSFNLRKAIEYILKANIKLFIVLIFIILATYFASQNSKRLLIQSSGWDAATHYKFVEAINENTKFSFNDYPKLFHFYLSPFYILINQYLKNISDQIILKISLLSIFVNLIVFYPFIVFSLYFLNKNKIQFLLSWLFLPFYYEIISKISVQGHYAQLLNNFFILKLLILLFFEKKIKLDIFEKVIIFISLFYSYYFFFPAFLVFFMIFLASNFTFAKNLFFHFLFALIVIILFSFPVLRGFLIPKNINTILTVWGGVESLNLFDKILFLGFFGFFGFYFFNLIKKKKILTFKQSKIFILLFNFIIFTFFIFLYQKTFTKVISYSFYKALISTYLIFFFIFLIYLFQQKIKQIIIVLSFLIVFFIFGSEKKIIHFFRGTFNFLHPHIYNSAIMLIESDYPLTYTVHPLLGIEQTYWSKTLFEKRFKVDYSYLVFNDLKNLKNKKETIIFDPTFKIKNTNKILKEIIVFPLRGN